MATCAACGGPVSAGGPHTGQKVRDAARRCAACYAAHRLPVEQRAILAAALERLRDHPADDLIAGVAKGLEEGRGMSRRKKPIPDVFCCTECGRVVAKIAYFLHDCSDKAPNWTPERRTEQLDRLGVIDDR